MPNVGDETDLSCVAIDMKLYESFTEGFLSALDRARCQIALAKSMEDNFEQMKEIVCRFSK